MVRTLLLLVCLLCSHEAFPQDYPERTIRLVVPTAPGGGVDGIARIVAAGLQASLGRPVVVENRPGGGGSVGLNLVAQAPRDGYVFGVAAVGHIVINPHFVPNAGDPARDFVAVAKLIESPLVIVSNPGSGIKTLQDIIVRSKADPKGLSYASSGVYAGPHLMMELLKKATNANLVHIPYRGTGPAVTAVLSNDVPIASTTFAAARGQIQAKTLFPVALPGAKRSALMPDVPTISELGLPGFGKGSWVGLFAPAGTSDAIVRRISSEVGKIYQQPSILKQIADLASDPEYENDVEFAKFFAREIREWNQELATLPKQ
jgi:tripartite-type tricarboxylate transporter receptor subunit TctC